MNSFTDYTTLILNNTLLKGNEIISFCRKSDNSVFHPIGDFIEEWLSANPILYIHTSGSTGTPKKIAVQKNRMLYSASLTAQFFEFQSGQNALLCLPVNYIAGKMMIVRAMFCGLNLICVPPSQNPLENLSPDLQIDFAPMIPMQYQAVENLPALSQIKNLLIGGGALNEDLDRQASPAKTQIFHGYGMTETLSHIALRKVNGENKSDYYTAFPEIQLGIDDRNCLTIQAPHLIDDLLITNDLVELIDKNKFLWKGRYDHVINSGGIKFYPEVLEKKLSSILFPRRFFVTSQEDERLGEKLILIIEGNPLTESRIHQLNDSMRVLLDKYELPKEIHFVEKFVQTESGKINRLQTRILALKE
jgi:O-succinylbenzoic acid--CoA ligase